MNNNKKKQLTLNKKKLILFSFLLFFNFFSNLGFSQTPPEIVLSWNINVGCQVYSPPKEREISVEDIEQSVCIKVCENSNVIYTLTGALGTNPNVQWIAAGGTASAPTNTATTSSTQVTWGAFGTGSISFTMNTASGGTITKTLCIEIIKRPEAQYSSFPLIENEELITVCAGQPIILTDLSSANGGTAIVTHYWDFGDGTFSAAQNPSHTYFFEGQFEVILTVTNACGCSSTFTKQVEVKPTVGFEISCPSVVCDSQTSTYNLPFDGEQVCNEYNFTVEGGTITDNPNNGSVTVVWDNVDALGFGFLTFNPEGGGCGLECPIPTTIKIPVIQTIGTIQGDAVMCLGTQGRYKLPQWPATNFQWEVLGNVSNSLAFVIPTDQSNEIIIQPTQSGTITLVCTYQNTLLHCGGSATFTIQVNLPEPVTGPSNLCINSTGNYHTVSNHAVNWTLVKNGTVVNTLSNNSNYNYTFTSAGNYSLTVSGPNVCGNQTTSITVNPIPVAPLIANITAPTALICPVAPYTYSVTVPNPNMDYSWAITGGSIAGSSTDTEVTVSFNQTGPYSLQLTQRIKGQSSCVSPPLTITPNVFVIQADLSNSATALNPALGSCANLVGTYYAVNSVGAGLYTLGETYTWSISPSSLGSIITGQGTNTVDVLWNNTSVAATAHLILQITKCTRTTVIDRMVAITPLPNLTLTATNTCSGIASTMTLSSSNGVPFAAGTVINWNYGNGNNSVQTLGSATSAITNYYNYYTAPTGNVSYTITASITNPNGCTGTVTKTTNVTITPGPLATAAIQSGGNLFCIPSPITTVLQAAASTGATINWYKTSSGTVLGTSGTYAPTSAGIYYFIATLNGCSTYSNYISVVVQNCSPPPTCTLSPVPAISVAQTVSLNCGNLSLAATASPAPLASNWTIVGPDPDADAWEQPGSDLYHYSTPITAAGTYNVVYKAKYTCTDGSTGFLPTSADIIVPYIATFTTAVTCNGSSFDITLTNTSSFITSVGSRRYFYYVSNYPGGPWTAVNNLSAATTTYTLAAGTYYFKLVIDGIQQGASTYSPVCEKVSDAINLAADPVQNITVSDNDCYNSAVGFGIDSPILNETYLWTFDTQSTNLPLAQNTLESPSRVFDPVPSGAAHPVTVTVVITNKYGCTRTLSTTITIPARCYFGDIVTPTPSICKNGSMVLQYQPNATQADNCVVSQYQWMEGSNPTPIATTTIPSYTVPVVTGTPFYWIRLINASGCVYNGTARLTPAFLPLPTAQIAAPGIVCQSSGASATITTNATSFYWYVDNVQQTAYNSISSLPLNNFALGNHVLSLTAFGANGCNKTVTQNFTVKASPNVPTVSYYVVDCSNYKIQLIATPPAGGTGTLTWSSGTPGNPTTVHSGGPYMVTYNDGSGCVSTAQLDVPYSLDKYLWVFPSGCYTMCETNLGTLIGPDVQVQEWQWLYEGNTEISGIDLVDPYQPTQTGVYNLLLNSACPQVSAPMNVTINQCEECPFIVEPKGVECIQEGLYSYALSLTIDNMSGDIINTTITVPGDEVIIAPAAIAVEPGANTYNFTLIPINGFAGGTVTFVLNGIDPHSGTPCTYEIRIELQDCRAAKTTDKKDLVLAESNANSLLLYPNPAQGAVNAQFECQSNEAVIAVYDLTGKQLAVYDAKNKKGTVNVALTHFASGIYVVVLKENGQITMQKKLVIE